MKLDEKLRKRIEEMKYAELKSVVAKLEIKITKEKTDQLREILYNYGDENKLKTVMGLDLIPNLQKDFGNKDKIIDIIFLLLTILMMAICGYYIFNLFYLQDNDSNLTVEIYKEIPNQASFSGKTIEKIDTDYIIHFKCMPSQQNKKFFDKGDVINCEISFENVPNVSLALSEDMIYSVVPFGIDSIEMVTPNGSWVELGVLPVPQFTNRSVIIYPAVLTSCYENKNCEVIDEYGTYNIAVAGRLYPKLDNETLNYSKEIEEIHFHILYNFNVMSRYERLAVDNNKWIAILTGLLVIGSVPIGMNALKDMLKSFIKNDKN